jgi:hypothetical protein
MSEATARPDADFGTPTSKMPRGLEAFARDAFQIDSAEVAFLMTRSHAPRIERFSTVPEILLEEAQRIEIWAVPRDENSDCNLPSHLLLMARDSKTDGVVTGCELVAYPCDAAGRVASWHNRYATSAVNFTTAAQKLRCQIVNGLARLQHIEDF